MESIQKRLFELRNESYREFQCKLIPSVEPERVIGVRTPALRALARRLSGTAEANEFIKNLPHEYYDENNLHGFLIERIKDYDACVSAVETFLPYVDNWATCDLMSPKVFKKHLTQLLERIKAWTASGEIYTVRFGIEMLMSFYLDEAFLPEYLALVADVKSGEYYVNMMRAWFFATALAKQYDETIKYVEQKALDEWTHNKTIQKAVESYRISDEQKEYLRSLKVKQQKG